MCGGGGQEQEEPLRRIRINKNNAADRNNLIIMRKNKNKNKKQEHPRGRHVAQVAQQIAAVWGPCRLSSWHSWLWNTPSGPSHETLHCLKSQLHIIHWSEHRRNIFYLFQPQATFFY